MSCHGESDGTSSSFARPLRGLIPRDCKSAAAATTNSSTHCAWLKHTEYSEWQPVVKPMTAPPASYTQVLLGSLAAETADEDLIRLRPVVAFKLDAGHTIRKSVGRMTPTVGSHAQSGRNSEPTCTTDRVPTLVERCQESCEDTSSAAVPLRPSTMPCMVGMAQPSQDKRRMSE
jgi:hypothetical protein